MNKSQKSTASKDEILQKALIKAAELGWSTDLVNHLNEEFGVTAFSTYFPNGLNDLVYAFADWADAQMIFSLEKQGVDDLKIRARIFEGVKARLQALEPHKAAFKASTKYLMHPRHIFDLKRIGWTTADKLWWCAGDTATDYNHYTKRILLSGVFASTTLYWLRDSSDNHEKTWDFLEHRINNVLKIGKFMGKLKKRA